LESPSAKSAATKPRIFSLRSTVTWIVYSIIEATALLQQAIQRLSQRGLITIQTTQSLNASESDIDEPASKRRKLKEEMLNELRRSASSTANEMNVVVMKIKTKLRTVIIRKKKNNLKIENQMLKDYIKQMRKSVIGKGQRNA